MKKIPKVTVFLLSLFLINGMLSIANALLIYPINAQYSGTNPGNPDADDVETITSSNDLALLYKADVPDRLDDPVIEGGYYASSYDSTFSNNPTDPADADITYSGGSYITGFEPLYLLVKDGNHDPIWYIINLLEMGWNGTETLQLRSFWPSQGAISHVSIFGDASDLPPPASSVPEPATMFLLGTGLVGIAGISRKKIKR